MGHCDTPYCGWRRRAYAPPRPPWPAPGSTGPTPRPTAA
ncbi:hypothetical protein L532_3490 [Bordetella bronchiseptica OSU095]|nr:hypothetical protein L532_3490 [Bordetella bronchiseptica OSU095]